MSLADDGYEDCQECQGGGEVECTDCDGDDDTCWCDGLPVECPDCEDGLVEVS